VAGAWLLDLLEERQESLTLAVTPTSEVPVHLLPYRIVTVELAFVGHGDHEEEEAS